MSQIIRIVVAYPAALEAEKECVREVARRINRHSAGLAQALGSSGVPTVEVDSWETSAIPGLSNGGPQPRIDSMLRIEESDIVVGLLCDQLRPGTEHEIRTALKTWRAQRKPDLWVYFKRFQPQMESSEDSERLTRLLRFKEDLFQQAFAWEFDTPIEFERIFYDHLSSYVNQRMAQQHASAFPGSPLVCDAQAAPRFVRQEGLSELVGDIQLLVVKSSDALPPSAMAAVELYFGANVTNRLIRDRTTDAILFCSHQVGGGQREFFINGRPLPHANGLAFDT